MKMSRVQLKAIILFKISRIKFLGTPGTLSIGLSRELEMSHHVDLTSRLPCIFDEINTMASGCVASVLSSELFAIGSARTAISTFRDFLEPTH